MRGLMSVQRKSFVFPQDVSERLERLTSTTRLESNSSVVRLALVVLEDLVDAIAKGEKIVIQDESGHTRAYNPFVAPGPLEKRRPGSSRDAA
jgi:Arc/MetJ-type ribon-helix-helix transcriptional regulator